MPCKPGKSTLIILSNIYSITFNRRLGDEMRSMSMEKSRQREAELLSEIEKLQGDIKLIQRSSEEGANVSQKLSKEVRLLCDGVLKVA